MPRSCLEINSNNLINNLNKLQKAIDPLALVVVLKANAYGMGLSNIAELAARAGVRHVAVIELEAALKIKNLFPYVHFLGSLQEDEISTAIENDFLLPCDSLLTAKKIVQFADSKTVQIELEIDTGMGRLGIPYFSALEDIQEIKQIVNLNIKGIYSHFPCSDQDLEFSNLQINRTKNLLSELKKSKIDPEFIHIANSGAIHKVPLALQEPFNLARTGIAIYGETDSANADQLELSPVVSFKSKLIAIRELPAGYSIGYARSHILSKATRIGTVSAGYADGVPFQMANQGKMFVRDQACAILGRISMDFTTIDLSNVNDPKVGEEVEIVGKNQSLRTLAEYKQSIVYDLLCAFPNRVERKII